MVLSRAGMPVTALMMDERAGDVAGGLRTGGEGGDGWMDDEQMSASSDHFKEKRGAVARVEPATEGMACF